MVVEQGVEQATVGAIAELLMCPDCGGGLHLAASEARCTSCSAVFPIREGVLHMARYMTLQGAAPEDPRTSDNYQRQYAEEGRAAEYNALYRERFTKRLSTQREYRLLTGLLGSQPRSQRLLDLPCGGGRLSPALAPFTDLLIEADIGAGQVLHAKHQSHITIPQVWLTASGFKIPLRSASVDGVVCCRLSHHLPQAEERERLVSELLRVSKRFALMTYFDYSSPKNLSRRLRAPFNHKPPKCTMTRSRIEELAAKSGARLVACPWLSLVGSGHRFALMVKQGAGS
jgi:SAM-dependent methyltransferase